MILHELKLIFIHTPKCAGESIETALMGGPNRGYKGDPFEGTPDKHWGVRDWRLRYPVEFASYFKFSVVRNPWDRIVSWVSYRDLRYARIRGSFQDRMRADLSWRNWSFGRLLKEKSFKNMLFLDGRLAVDYVIRFENLQNGFDEVCDKIAIPRTILPFRNRTDHRPYWEYYDDNLINRVRRRFEFDIQYFDYEFRTLTMADH